MDVLSDELLGVAEIAKLAHVTSTSVRRWIRVGVVHNGSLVKLRTVKIAGRRYATPGSYQQFVEETSAEDDE